MTRELDLCTTIVEEVFQMLFTARDTNNYSAIEARLQELLYTLNQYEPIQLAMYCRSTAHAQNFLPTWQPLLNRSIEHAKMMGANTDDMFYGLLAYK